MTTQTRRGALLAAIVAPLGLGRPGKAATRTGTQPGKSDDARQVARAWFMSSIAGQLDPRTHPSVVLVLHGNGAGLDGVAERFEGREAVAAVLAGMGPARCEVEEALADEGRVALRGTTYFPNGRAAAFAAFVTLCDDQVVQVERHLDRILRQA